MTQTIESAFTPEGLQIVWDSTSIKRAATCPRYYQYKKLGWEPLSRSVHLEFGLKYATALEQYHKHRASGQTHDDALLLVVQSTMEATWIRGVNGPGVPQVFDHPSKTRENLIRTIIWYLEEFADDNMQTLILSNGKPAVELSFRIPVDDGIILSGHFDRIVTYGSDNYVTDNKTTQSTIGPYFFNAFKPDFQMAQYTFAGTLAFGIPLKGVVIDGAQIAVGFSRFERSIVTFSDEELEEWYGDVREIIFRTHEYTRKNYFPMNRTACGNYGGCEFRGVCSSPPALRENFLRGDFIQTEPWNPLKVR